MLRLVRARVYVRVTPLLPPSYRADFRIWPPHDASGPPLMLSYRKIVSLALDVFSITQTGISKSRWCLFSRSLLYTSWHGHFR